MPAGISRAETRNAQREVPLQAGARESPGGLIALLVASMTSPSAAFSRNERELKVAAAIGQLGAKLKLEHRIRLRDLQSLPTKEIADQLGKTDGAIRVLLNCSLQRLQIIMERDWA